MYICRHIMYIWRQFYYMTKIIFKKINLVDILKSSIPRSLHACLLVQYISQKWHVSYIILKIMFILVLLNVFLFFIYKSLWTSAITPDPESGRIWTASYSAWGSHKSHLQILWRHGGKQYQYGNFKNLLRN